MALPPNLDSGLRAAIEQIPFGATDLSLSMETLSGQRAQIHAIMASAPVPDTRVSIENLMVPGPEGAPDIRLRIYRPEAPGQGRPGLYWMHGGGTIFGIPEMDDPVMIEFVERLGIVAVSVEYRLSPENPHPAPFDDCYAGLSWVAKNAAELGIDPSRLAVGGASAGGGLATAIAMLARDRGGPDVAFQLLVGPMLDDRNITPSSHEFADAVVWDRENNLFSWSALLGDRVGTDDVPPYAAPARATDLSGMPPAFVDVGELEVFRDEALDYAQRLVQAGVSTELHLYPGAFHGFDQMLPDVEVSKRARQARVTALKRAFGL